MITEAEFSLVATSLGISKSRVKAVYEVESNGYGFLPDGRLKTLFEGHVFWRQLEGVGQQPGQILKHHPHFSNIIYEKWTKKHYMGGVGEWVRVSHAIEVCKIIGANTILALNSASYGAFQIMGFNAVKAGYSDAQAMIAHMNEAGEVEQLWAFSRYIKSTGLVNYLRDGNFQKFAYHYNGKGYKGNLNVDWDDYDLKLARADKKYSTQV